MGRWFATAAAPPIPRQHLQTQRRTGTGAARGWAPLSPTRAPPATRSTPSAGPMETGALWMNVGIRVLRLVQAPPPRNLERNQERSQERNQGRNQERSPPRENQERSLERNPERSQERNLERNLERNQERNLERNLERNQERSQERGRSQTRAKHK